MKKVVVFGLALLSLGAIGWGQELYAFYYDLSGGQDLVVNVMNAMPNASAFILEVFDAFGNSLWTKAGELEPYEAVYYTLSDYAPQSNNSWGVVTISSEEKLVIGLEYYADGELVSMDTVSRTVPDLEAGVPYWLGVYYTQAQGISTGVIIMNPWSAPTTVSVSVRNPNDDEIYATDLSLSGYESEFLDLEKLIGTGNLLWGLVDVKMAGQAVVVAVEYYGNGLEIENVTEYYF